MGMIPITCTQCGGASQIDQAWLGQWVQCPHCGQPTQALKLASEVPPPAPVGPESVAEAKTQAVVKPEVGAKPQAEAAEPAPRAPLTREQRLAIRRRRHLVLAIGGGVLLAATAYVLFLLSQ